MKKEEKRNYRFASEKLKTQILDACGIVAAILIVGAIVYKGVLSYINVTDDDSLAKAATKQYTNCSKCTTEECLSSCFLCQDESTASCAVDTETGNELVSATQTKDNTTSTSNDSLTIPTLFNGLNLTSFTNLNENLKNVRVITMDKFSIGLIEGATYNLNAKAFPNSTLTYKSYNPNVATVSETGLITAIDKGYALITIKAGSSTAFAFVSVTDTSIPTKNIVTLDNSLYVAVGKSKYIIAKSLPLNNTDTITYQAQDPSIASVDDKGLVTGETKGKTIITITSGKIKKEYLVYSVTTASTTSIILNKTKLNLALGNTYQLTAKTIPQKTTDPITYSADNEYVSVDRTGLVTALKEGVGTVTVTSGLKVATVKVTVTSKIPVRRLLLNHLVIYMGTGKTKALKAYLIPKNTTDKITYLSSDPNIASVSETGIITALKPGYTEITAQVSEKITTVKVYVSNSANTKIVYTNRTVFALQKGHKFKLKATRSPASATDEITYTSLNKDIATIDINGVITGLKKGIAKIKVTSGKASRIVTVIVRN